MNELVKKKGRGRPKGSKNKEAKNGKKWGRPKGSKNKKKICIAFENGKQCSCECMKSESFCLKHYRKFMNMDFDNENDDKPINIIKSIENPFDNEFEIWEYENNYDYYVIDNIVWKYYPSFEKWVKYNNNYKDNKHRFENIQNLKIIK